MQVFKPLYHLLLLLLLLLGPKQIDSQLI